MIPLPVMRILGADSGLCDDHGWQPIVTQKAKRNGKNNGNPDQMAIQDEPAF